MNVVSLPVTDLKDIAAQLRRMADFAETCEEQLSCLVVLGRSDGTVRVYGWGHRVSALEVQGWLARAVADVAGSVESCQKESA
jgi:hypothetical protein